MWRLWWFVFATCIRQTGKHHPGRRRPDGRSYSGLTDVSGSVCSATIWSCRIWSVSLFPLPLQKGRGRRLQAPLALTLPRSPLRGESARSASRFGSRRLIISISATGGVSRRQLLHWRSGGKSSKRKITKNGNNNCICICI